MNFNIVTVVSVKRSDYRILFLYMSKNDTINIMKDSDLNEKNVSLSFFFFFFLLYIKMSETTYYQRNRDVIINRAKDC